MNGYISDSIARDHVDSMLAAAAASRRAKAVRQERRSRRATAKRSADRRKHSATAASVGHAVTRPFVAVHSWYAAGEL